MSITAKLTRNFQITIPAEVRKKLSLKEGDILAFGVKSGKIIAFPVQRVKRHTSSSEEWSAREKKADEEIKRGDVIGPFEDLEEAFRYLDAPVEE